MKRTDYTPLNIIERMNSKISLISSIAALVLFVLIFSFIDYEMVQKPVLDQQKQEEESAETKRRLTEDNVVSSVSVVAVGDNLYHDSLISAGKKESGEWYYGDYYEYVRDAVQAADLAIVDQETVLSMDHSVATGYPKFATPIEVAQALVKTGFDVVYSATNHMDDYGSEYLLNTVSYWQNNYPEITLAGIHNSQADADTIKIREVNGIRIAFLSYTYGTNGFGYSGDEACYLDVFSEGSEKIGQKIQQAKSQADVVVFISHWGIEDEPMPSEYEKQWATFLMQQGVDVCIGGHTHCLQPYGYLSDKDGHKMLIFYSLGNFMSGQKNFVELLEGMGCFTIQRIREPDGTVSTQVVEPAVRPMVMHYNADRTRFRVYFLEDYSDELAQEHGAYVELNGMLNIKNLRRKYEEIMSINVKPSTGTNLLNVKQLWDGTLLDPLGNVVLNTANVTEYQYYGKLGIDILDYTKDPAYGYNELYTDK